MSSKLFPSGQVWNRSLAGMFLLIVLFSIFTVFTRPIMLSETVTPIIMLSLGLLTFAGIFFAFALKGTLKETQQKLIQNELRIKLPELSSELEKIQNALDKKSTSFADLHTKTSRISAIFEELTMAKEEININGLSIWTVIFLSISSVLLTLEQFESYPLVVDSITILPFRLAGWIILLLGLWTFGMLIHAWIKITHHETN